MFSSTINKIKVSYRMARMTVQMIEQKMMMDTKAESAVSKIVGLLVIAVLAGALIPTAMTSLKGANTTTWTASEIAVYGIIAIMIIIAVVLLVVKLATE